MIVCILFFRVYCFCVFAVGAFVARRLVTLYDLLIRPLFGLAPWARVVQVTRLPVACSIRQSCLDYKMVKPYRRLSIHADACTLCCLPQPARRDCKGSWSQRQKSKSGREEEAGFSRRPAQP